MTTNEQNIALISRYREAVASGDGRAAKGIAAAIVTGNEGLAKKLAKRYARPETLEDLKDAEQAARMGVLRSIVDFDPERGSFSTYAGHHIRDYVQRWTGKTTSVSRPRAATMPASVARAAAKFRMQHGREPSAGDLGVTESQLAEWSSGTHFVEIDDYDDDKPRLELTYDSNAAENEARCVQLEAAWNAAIADLSPRNRDIADRVLLKGEQLVEVAASHGLTHGRVQQICKRIEVRLKRAINPSAYDPAEDIDRKEAKRQAERRVARRRGAAA